MADVFELIREGVVLMGDTLRLWCAGLMIKTCGLLSAIQNVCMRVARDCLDAIKTE